MKRYSIFIILVTVVLASTLIGSAAGYVKNEHNNEVTAVSEKQYYIIKDYNGRIAVFESGRETPSQIFEIYTSSLPEADAKKLLSGIRIENAGELSKVIEEYTS